MERRVLLLSLSVAGAVACATVLGIEERPLRPDAVAEDAGNEAAADPCAHTRLDGPPDRDDAPGSIPPFYLAVRTLVFTGDKALQAGFDLDGVCTCDKRPHAAFDGGSSCKAPSPDCDVEGGVDNRGAAFFGQFMDVVDFDQFAAIAEEADLGERATIFHIAEYNGTANDTDVRVGLMTSRGIRDGSGCGTVVADGGPGSKAPAGWCGHDKWTYPSALVVPQTKVPISRMKGWVRNGRLMFESDTSVSLFIAEAAVRLTKAVGSGNLTKGADGTWHLEDGVMAGRIPLADLLIAVGTSSSGKRPDGGRGQFCEEAVYQTVKTSVCQQPDILAASEGDNTGAACDAVSTAVSFAAQQADIGDEYTPKFAVGSCAPEKVDASVYACP